jgi:ABC-type transporter Mla MlaB component
VRHGGRVQLAIRAPITPASLPALTQRCCAFFAANPNRLVECDVTDVEPDAVCVEALARLQLVARRSGCTVVLCNPSRGLLELVELMGLTDVLPQEPGSSATGTS